MAEVTLETTTADLDFVSRRISDTVRLAAAAFLVFAWGLLIAPPAGLPISGRGLLAAGLFATAALVLDLAQYAVGYVCTRRMHRRLLETPTHTLPGYERDAWYRARAALFWAKQVAIGVAFVTLATTLLPPILARL
jgi:hypothetical protein